MKAVMIAARELLPAVCLFRSRVSVSYLFPVFSKFFSRNCVLKIIGRSFCVSADIGEVVGWNDATLNIFVFFVVRRCMHSALRDWRTDIRQTCR